MFIVGCVGGGGQQRHHLEGENESLLQIYFKKNEKSNFTLYSKKFVNGHTTTINDVAWAPLVGRSFHMIASCSKDSIMVWKVIVRDIFKSD
jgi:hypothetical protein